MSGSKCSDIMTIGKDLRAFTSLSNYNLGNDAPFEFNKLLDEHNDHRAAKLKTKTRNII